MKKQTVKSLIVLFLVLFIHCGCFADRITMFKGDIFISQGFTEQDGRYIFERFGYKYVIPRWNVKKMEAGVNILESTADGIIFASTKTIQLMEKDIILNSNPPAEAAHWEMYPEIQLYGIERYRYIRGYIANRTMYGYKQLHLELVFYDASDERIMQSDAELFDVYPMTAKPFGVDVRFVPWNKVERIRLVTLSGVKMKPRPPYLHLK